MFTRDMITLSVTYQQTPELPMQHPFTSVSILTTDKPQFIVHFSILSIKIQWELSCNSAASILHSYCSSHYHLLWVKRKLTGIMFHNTPPSQSTFFRVISSDYKTNRIVQTTTFGQKQSSNKSVWQKKIEKIKKDKVM